MFGALFDDRVEALALLENMFKAYAWEERNWAATIPRYSLIVDTGIVL